jgi:hypothetical protein
MSNEKSSWDQLYSGATRARGLGARLTAEAKRPSVEQSPSTPHTVAETLGSTALSGLTGMEIEPAEQESHPRTRVGFATDPGYDDTTFNRWGGRQVNENPRHF